MPALHLFIDTNIFLNFYSFSDDRLEILDELIELTAPGQISLHLPKQVENELKRNREAKLQVAMSDFKSAKLSTGVPNHMLGTQAARQYDEAVRNAEHARKLLIANATSLALRNELEVDQKIRSLFENATRYEEDDELYQKALVRMNKGNPPGKPQSIGDRYIWEVLLHHAPVGDLFIISKDGDYVSPLTMDKTSRPLAFLADEWTQSKAGSLTVFRKIKDVVTYYKNLQEQPDAVVPAPAGGGEEPAVMQNEQPPVAELPAAAEPQRNAVPIPPRAAIDAAIQRLVTSRSFRITHAAIAALKPYLLFLTQQDAELLFQGAIDNAQISGIITDDDVSDLYLDLVNRWVTSTNLELSESIIELLGLSTAAPDEEAN